MSGSGALKIQWSGSGSRSQEVARTGAERRAGVTEGSVSGEQKFLPLLLRSHALDWRRMPSDVVTVLDRRNGLRDDDDDDDNVVRKLHRFNVFQFPLQLWQYGLVKLQCHISISIRYLQSKK